MLQTLISRHLEKARELFDTWIPAHIKKYLQPRGLAVAATGLAVLSVCSGYGSRPLGNFAGFIYPLYRSIKALRIKELDNDKQWLMYWVVYGWFSIFESFLGRFLSWLPFYQVTKLAFLVWCFLPQTKGAMVVFKYLLEPLMVQYEAEIDRKAQEVLGEAKLVTDEVAEGIKQHGAAASVAVGRGGPLQLQSHPFISPHVVATLTGASGL